MLTAVEVYLPDPREVELRPFEDRVLALVRLFGASRAVRLRIVGTIAAGKPIEAHEGPAEYVEIHGPAITVEHHHLLPLLRRHLCPALQRVSGDAFEIARAITPILVSLKLSGAVPINLDPWLFAGLALLIERMGVEAFCADGEDTEDTKPSPTARATTVQRSKHKHPRHGMNAHRRPRR